jgi:GH25 family lysozyme M1 (1,4-beta-N-acetylmuramidase)
MTGIDISQWQSAIAPGAWGFIFCRATHDGLGVDLMFDEHFPNALARAPRRGAYHFAKPIVSSGAAQAQHFAQVCIANGFRVGVDLWALDFEANALGSQAANVAWIREFMATARALLGGRAFLYIGWPYYGESCGGDVSLLHESPWWLPAYGPNDGQPHTYTAPFVPCVHQYTSRGGPNLSGLDVNSVLDTALWTRTVATAPAPKPAPPVPPKQSQTIDHGDDNVKTTDITGIHLDTHGCGEVAVKGVAESHVIATLIIGGDDANAQKRYDKVPVARVVAGSNPALVVIEEGEPSGVYTLRVSSV